MKVLFLTLISLIASQTALSERQSPHVEIQPGLHRDDWRLTRSDGEGYPLWEVHFQGVTDRPRPLIHGSRLWVALNFHDQLLLDDRVTARCARSAGFWAAFDLRTGELLTRGKVVGGAAVTIAGLTTHAAQPHLLGLHGGKTFSLPLLEPLGDGAFDATATVWLGAHPLDSIGDPQDHSDNPEPPIEP